MENSVGQEEVGETVIEQRDSKPWLWVVLAVVVTALVVGGGVYGWMRVAERDASQTEDAGDSALLLPTSDEQEVEVVSNAADWVYDLRTYGELAPGEFDQRLVRVNVETGETETVVESIKTAIPALQERFNEVLWFVSFPRNSSHIIMESVLNSTDDIAGILYSFDSATNQFKRLDANQYRDPSFVLGEEAVSPNGRFLLSIYNSPEGEQLLVIDLIQDTARPLVTLSAGETFVSETLLVGDNLKKVSASWRGNSEVDYGVFDKDSVSISELGGQSYSAIRRDLVDVFAHSSSDSVGAGNDNRILLEPSTYSQYLFAGGDRSRCLVEELGDFNSDDPTTVVRYEDQQRGIAFDVPYNPVWGNERFRVEPYEVTERGVRYGSIFPFEGCSLAREYDLNFLAAKSGEALVAEVKNDPAKKDLFSVEPSVVQINNLDVVKYSNGGLCFYPTLVVLGERYNYEFVPTCGGDDGDFVPLEEMVRSVQLLD